MRYLTYKQLGQPTAPGSVSLGGLMYHLDEQIFTEWKEAGFAGRMGFDEIGPMNEAPQWIAISINTGEITPS